MTSEKLENAIQLIQSGDRQAAVPILRSIIQENRADEDAWLLLYTCVDDVEHKKFCLQSVLSINPNNQEARDALAALINPEPAPVQFSWQQPDNIEPNTLHWDEHTEPEEIVLEQKLERKKMEWEQTESERLEQEKAEREKVERKRIEREKAELERVESLKMEWEKTESERKEKEGKEKEKREQALPEQKKADPRNIEIPKINWEEWDIEEPTTVKPLKQKAVKVTYQSSPYRKPRRNWRFFFTMLGMMVLFLMFFTVCMVLVLQVISLSA